VPVPLIACLVALAVAGVVTAATPTLLGWLPVPPDEEDVAPFSTLDSPRFRLSVFWVAAAAGCIVLCLTAPTHWAVWAPFAGLGALLGLIDLHTTFLPLRLTYLSLALVLLGAGLAAWLDAGWAPVLGAVAGAAVGAALFWVVWRFSGGQLGFGDVRLAGVIGAAAGSGGSTLLLWSFLLGTFAGAVWAVAVRLRRRAEAEFPYGPALLLGPLLALAVQAALPAG
jgi:leader peptidase (prepilin peptidase)/N-methyltransferase